MLGILCSNELLILNVKFFLDVSCTYRCIFEMENGSNVALLQLYQLPCLPKWNNLIYFFNPLRINEAKRAEY